uniref:SFRICE_036259 n=1 Tax=Spodoptera frugiperda TaxID=7108 RepID=A0A2H1WTH8_SPOFR
MAARAAVVRGGKVEIRKEHTQIYKFTNFQNSRKTFQLIRRLQVPTSADNVFVHSLSAVTIDLN